MKSRLSALVCKALHDLAPACLFGVTLHPVSQLTDLHPLVFFLFFEHTRLSLCQGLPTLILSLCLAPFDNSGLSSKAFPHHPGYSLTLLIFL